MATLDDNGAAGAGQRPTFLTVLCILTFIGSPLSLITNLMAYFALSGELGQLALAGYEALGISINPIGYLIVGVLSLGSLFGALQMWKLQKMGFYIYVAVTVVCLVISFLMLGGLALGGMAIVSVILAAVFPILYGLNLQHMS